MDLSILNKKVFIIPTPGQTEQEYLAHYHNKKSSIKYSSQDNFKLDQNIDFNKFQPFKKTNLLEKGFENVGL
jgi:hypothetical protein